MSMLDSAAVLIDCAKRLRGIAEALDATDLKSQIVEEMLRLHETRESLLLAGNNGGAGQPEPTVRRIPAQPAKLLVDGDSKIFTFDADEVTETYDLHLEAQAAKAATAGGSPANAAAPAATTAVTTAAAAASRGAARPAAGDGKKRSSSPSEAEVVRASDTGELPASGAASANGLTDDQRFAAAEQRIVELEPLHQAALRKMNDILTDEQRQAKSAATRAGMKAGKKGRDLQQAVMAALNLTPDQQQRMAAARKELLDVRQAIGKQVEGLLSKDQLEHMLQQFAKKHGG